jgi:hypothetical protein
MDSESKLTPGISGKEFLQINRVRLIKSTLSYKIGSGAQDKPWRGFRDEESTCVLTSSRPQLLF